MTNLNTCFQCGKKTIVVKTYKEYVSGSLVTTTESVCSDPKCQEKTEKMLLKEKLKREGAYYSKSGFGKKKTEKQKNVTP